MVRRSCSIFVSPVADPSLTGDSVHGRRHAVGAERLDDRGSIRPKGFDAVDRGGTGEDFADEFVNRPLSEAVETPRRIEADATERVG